MAMNDFPIVAAAGRCVRWLDEHDRATTDTGRKLALQRLSAELRGLQAAYHRDAPPITDNPIDVATAAAVARVRGICRR